MVAATTTGCVTLPSRPAPGGSHPAPPAPIGRPGPTAPSAPRDRVGPVIPQPSPRRPDTARRDAPPPDRPPRRGGTRHGTGSGARPLPPAGAPARERAPAPPPPSRPPRLGKLPSGAELCALGRKYGRWQQDGPALRICRQTYG